MTDLPNLPMAARTLYGDNRTVDGHFFTAAQMREYGAKCAARPSLSAQAVGDGWREKLQRQCSEWGAYWRAPDAHGVELTEAQAIDLLAEVLGVEVEIQRPCGVWPDGQKCTKAHGHKGPCD